MAKSDFTEIDGFNPDELYRRPSRQKRQATPTQSSNSVPFSVKAAPEKEVAERFTENYDDPEGHIDTNDSNDSSQEVRPEKEKNAFVRFLTDERLRLFLGITLIFVCLFILIAFISHLKNGGADQSIVNNATPNEAAQSAAKAKNIVGPFGAWLSQIFLCDTLGLGSLAFLAYAWMLALNLLGYKKYNFWSLTFKTLLVAITVSIVCGLIFYATPTAFKWGGLHGYFVNAFLIKHTTVLGAIIVSCFLVSVVACVYIVEIRRAWLKWKQTSDKFMAKRQEKRREANKTQLATQASAPEIKAEGTQAHDNPIIFPKVQEQKESVLDDPIISTSSSVESGSQLTAKLEAGNQDTTKDDESINFLDTNEDFTGDVPEDKPNGETITQGNFSITIPEMELAQDIDERKKDPEQTSLLQKILEEEGPYDPRAELSKYRFPSIDLLSDRKSGVVIDMEEQQANKDRIEKTLLDYKIPISKIEATVGPTVTLYEIVPAEGVRISQIKRLEDDIALSLSALGIRIIAPIPGKGTVGIEVPNRDPQTVSMRSLIMSKKYQESKMALPMAIGATISNDVFIADLTKMPHLLVAGATGMGKSVGLNAIIASLLYKKHPAELKFVLIDPKMVEFSLYSKLERHYMAKLPDEEDAIITDPSKVIMTLNSLCVEMDNRYAMLRKANVRSLEEYNSKFIQRRLSPADGHKYLPYIVVVVDEFADLIMTAGKEVETPIARIAQKARAVGMHMIIATQRPSTNVITGIIKANFPGRIAFRVAQMVDSKTILDRTGANQLIGRGDMLFSHNGSLERVQCAFISTEEVEAITDSVDSQVGYEHAYYLPEALPESNGEGSIAGASTDRDAIFDEAARFVVNRQQGSTSMLQRQFNIGYNRAGRLMDQMEAAGIVGPVNGAKPRNILVDSITLESMLQNR